MAKTSAALVCISLPLVIYVLVMHFHTRKCEEGKSLRDYFSPLSLSTSQKYTDAVPRPINISLGSCWSISFHTEDTFGFISIFPRVAEHTKILLIRLFVLLS